MADKPNAEAPLRQLAFEIAPLLGDLLCRELAPKLMAELGRRRDHGKGSSWLTPKEVEAEFRIDTKTFANWRSARKGPPSYRRGGRVVYHRLEVEAWIRGEVTACLTA